MTQIHPVHEASGRLANFEAVQGAFLSFNHFLVAQNYGSTNLVKPYKVNTMSSAPLREPSNSILDTSRLVARTIIHFCDGSTLEYLEDAGIAGNRMPPYSEHWHRRPDHSWTLGLDQTCFKGCPVYVSPDSEHSTIHRSGNGVSCTTMMANAVDYVISKPTDGSRGSCADSIYFLCCDGSYRNALKQKLEGASGRAFTGSENPAARAVYDEVLRRVARLSKDKFEVKWN